VEQSEVARGMRVASLSGTYTGTISRVTRERTFWRRRMVLRRFWVQWDGDPGRGAAEHLPEDARYLLELDNGLPAGNPGSMITMTGSVPGPVIPGGSIAVMTMPGDPPPDAGS
jgi:hypothetical protein